MRWGKDARVHRGGSAEVGCPIGYTEVLCGGYADVWLCGSVVAEVCSKWV